MSLSAHPVQRDPAESSLCSLRPGGVPQRCEQDLWSLSKHMAYTLLDPAIGSLVSRDCFKEQGGVLTSLSPQCFVFKIFNHTFTKIHWDLGPDWYRHSMLGPKRITLQSWVLRFIISLSLSSRQWHKDLFGNFSLLNIYIFLSVHIYSSNPIVSQLTHKLHLRGNTQVWLEERSEISILGRAPHSVFTSQAVSEAALSTPFSRRMYNTDVKHQLSH